MADGELWQHATEAAGDSTVVAFLGTTRDGRLMLSVSDADAMELGLPLTDHAASQLHAALGEFLGYR